VTRARTRRRGQSISENLDSLLDTMANVVGVLVVLLAVTQLTVNDAMKRIRVFASEEGQAIARERDALEQRGAALEETELDRAQELATLDRQLRALRAWPDAAKAPTSAAEATTLAASRAAAVRSLESAVATKRQKLSALQVRVADRKLEADADHVDLRLPDPRPAPPDANRVVLLSRYQRVLYPDLDELEQERNREIREWVAVTGESLVGLGARALAEHFRTNDFGNQWMRWRILELRDNPFVRLEWRSQQAGDDLDALRSAESQLRDLLSGLDPKHHYLRFWVWSDSFEEYLAARRVAEDEGFSVGWEAMDSRQPLQSRLLGRSMRTPAPID